MKKIILIVSMCLLGQITDAQSTELGLFGGVSVYSGDLSEKEFGLYFENLKPAFGLFGRFNINRVLGLRLGVTHGQVKEVEEVPRREGALYNRNFRSNITEFALTAEVNLFRLGSSGGTQLVPYLFGGAALFNFRPEVFFDDNWVELQPLGTEGQGLPGYEDPYRLTHVALPLGGGVKIMMDGWTLGFELGGRKTFTDYLDDIGSQKVVYREVLEGNGELAAIISNPYVDPNSAEENPTYNRGGRFNDWYYFGGVTLSFELGGGGGYGGGRRSGRNIGCPTF